MTFGGRWGGCDRNRISAGFERVVNCDCALQMVKNPKLRGGAALRWHYANARGILRATVAAEKSAPLSSKKLTPLSPEN